MNFSQGSSSRIAPMEGARAQEMCQWEREWRTVRLGQLVDPSLVPILPYKTQLSFRIFAAPWKKPHEHPKTLFFLKERKVAVLGMCLIWQRCWQSLGLNRWFSAHIDIHEATPDLTWPWLCRGEGWVCVLVSCCHCDQWTWLDLICFCTTALQRTMFPWFFPATPTASTFNQLW